MGNNNNLNRSQTMKWNTVKTWREAGVEAKWGKVKGAPAMFLRPSHSKNFFMLSKSNLECIEKMIEDGHSIKDAVDNVFAVADVFSIPV